MPLTLPAETSLIHTTTPTDLAVPRIEANPDTIRPTLTVDVRAIQKNYRLLDKLSSPKCATGVVLKANAYGLDKTNIVPALWAAGARHFWVAYPQTALRIFELLRQHYGLRQAQLAQIYILHGIWDMDELRLCQDYAFTPVINNFDQLDNLLHLSLLQTRRDRSNGWSRHHSQGHTPTPMPIALHYDTGMTRLGFADDTVTLGQLDKIDWSRHWLDPVLIMSHLACADNPEHPKNAEQLKRFQKLVKKHPDQRASFSSSHGLTLGSEYHFDQVRIGRRLYGDDGHGLPFPDAEQLSLHSVVTYTAPILQIKTIHEKNVTVGYGATETLRQGQRIATVSVGYADGLLRHGQGKLSLSWNGVDLPVVGRISMDLVVVDLDPLEDAYDMRMPRVKDHLEIIGPHKPIHKVARDCGTIGYELLCHLSQRAKRIILDGDA